MSETELSEIDELVEIESRTNGDGSVDVTIENWEKKSSTRVKVDFELIDTVRSETMAWPEAGEGFERNKFYRLVKSCGLEMRNADLLEGEDARAKKVKPNKWELVVPMDESVHQRVQRVAREYLASGWEAFKKLPFKDATITLFWMGAVVFLMTFIMKAVA